jgi:hypothetical protein
MARAMQEPAPWYAPLNPTPQQLLNPAPPSSQGSVLPGFSWPEVGVQYGVYDAMPGLHVTCCGHMMHASCYAAHRWGFLGQDFILYYHYVVIISIKSIGNQFLSYIFVVLQPVFTLFSTVLEQDLHASWHCLFACICIM